MNGSSYHDDFAIDELGVFVKGNTPYIIDIEGNSEATKVFKE